MLDKMGLKKPELTPELLTYLTEGEIEEMIESLRSELNFRQQEGKDHACTTGKE